VLGVEGGHDRGRVPGIGRGAPRVPRRQRGDQVHVTETRPAAPRCFMPSIFSPVAI
jgi:hypothetical protein